MNPIEVVMYATRGVFDILLNVSFMGIPWAVIFVGFFIIRVMKDFVRALFRRDNYLDKNSYIRKDKR